MVPNNNVVVMPARHRDEIYVITDHIYRFTATGVPTTTAHPYPNGDTREQWISCGDGRLLGGRIGALYAVGTDGNVTNFPIAGRTLKHLVAATGERVWYSYGNVADDHWNAHTLVLAPATSPMEAVHLIEFAPCRIVHVASDRNTVAVLLMTMGATVADLNWKLAVFDETGNERWRADVADSIDNGVPLNNGFVAIGEHRVAVANAHGMLRSWDAATGQETTPR